MANYTTYKDSKGNEIQLKLESRGIVDLERRFGDSLQKKLAEIEKLSVAAEYVAAAVDNPDYNDRINIAYGIYDDMTSRGETLEQYHELIYNILVSGGFLKAENVLQLLEITAATAELEALTSEKQTAMINEKIEKLKNVPAETKTEE